ncbi:MAG: pseudouridine synthase [Pseudobdellovibrio sp.]
MIRPVFQNNNFIVCDKPAEVLSVPAREKSDKRDCLGTALQKQLKTQIFPVHRLDFEVSGLIIYALNSKAHQIAQSWFEKKIIHKTYRAETTEQNFLHWPKKIETDRTLIAPIAGSTFTWKTQILRGKKRSYESSHGEWAETKAEIVQKLPDSLLWNLEPVTGKSHQLRLELSRRGFPIFGDVLYGSQVKRSEPGISLRAFRINLAQTEHRLGLPDLIELPLN